MLRVVRMCAHTCVNLLYKSGVWVGGRWRFLASLRHKKTPASREASRGMMYTQYMLGLTCAVAYMIPVNKECVSFHITVSASFPLGESYFFPSIGYLFPCWHCHCVTYC
jgi:hypothetical protein